VRYVVYGAGAVGGVIGARLHLAGILTTLVARGDHLSRIRADGLVLDTAEGRLTVDAPTPPPTSSGPSIPWCC
jgi:2-dehydropantoate 2-reductase